MALCSWIRLARNLFGVVVLLLDHEVVRSSLDDALDLRQLVPGDDGEASRHRPDRFVLGERQRDLLGTGCTTALAVELNLVGGRLDFDEVLDDLGHAFVHLAKQGFVARKALLSFPHRAILPKPSLERQGLGLPRAGRWPPTRGVSVVQTEDTFRRANERIAEKGHELRWRFPVPFLCECSDKRCLERVALTLAEYKRVRSHSHRYLTVPGHEVEGAFLIEHDKRVAFAEKRYAST